MNRSKAGAGLGRSWSEVGAKLEQGWSEAEFPSGAGAGLERDWSGALERGRSEERGWTVTGA